MQFLILAVAAVVLSFLLGEQMGVQQGIATGKKEALSLNPVSMDLEMTCVSLWASQQNKEFVNRGMTR